MESNFEIQIDWISPDTPNFRAIGGLPARLSISYGPDVLTKFRITEKDSAESDIDFIEVDVLLLVNWLLDAFLYIKYQPKYPDDKASIDYEYLHSLNMINHGVAWPNISFYAHNKNSVALTNEVLTDVQPRSIIYISRNANYTISKEKFIEEIKSFFEKVFTQAEVLNIDVEDIKAEWEGLLDYEENYTVFVSCATALGFNIFDEQDLKEANETLEEVELYIPEEHIYEFCFLYPDKSKIVAEARHIAHTVENIKQHSGQLYDEPTITGLQELFNIAGSSKYPAQIGYETAEALRSIFEFDHPKPKQDLSQLLGSVGKATDTVQVMHLDQNSLLKGIGYGHEQTFGIAVRDGFREDNKKFHYWVTWYMTMFAYFNHPRQETVILYSEIADAYQFKMARSFAAELIAPQAFLQEMFAESDYVSQAKIERIAEQYIVPELLIRNQLENRLNKTILPDNKWDA